MDPKKISGYPSSDKAMNPGLVCFIWLSRISRLMMAMSYWSVKAFNGTLRGMYVAFVAYWNLNLSRAGCFKSLLQLQDVASMCI